jgi:hypothetical protein
MMDSRILRSVYVDSTFTSFFLLGKKKTMTITFRHKKKHASGDNQIKKKTLTGPDTTSIQGDDALVHASQAHPPPSGTKPQPTGSVLSGQQITDTPDVATHAALHV